MFIALYFCYFFNIITVFLFILLGLQGYMSFSIFGSNHATFALLAMIFYMFTQTLIIFFFTGMGVNIRDYVRDHEKDPSLYENNKKIKMLLFRPLLANIFFFILLCVTGGAVQSQYAFRILHACLFWGTFFHYLRVLKTEIRCFQSTVYTVLAMTGQRPYNEKEHLL